MELYSNITPKITTTEAKMLIGIKSTMSLANNKTGKLWRSFITSFISRGLDPPKEKISLQEYPQGYFESFHPATEFTKWALVASEDCPTPPESFNSFRLPGGLYAVFNYVGSGTDNSIFNYIYSKWLPASDYTLDIRPHFELLGEKYKNDDPYSEEEIWIPIKK